MSLHNKNVCLQTESWNVSKAREFYNIKEWSEGYFDVNLSGNIIATPDKDVCIDLKEVSKGIELQGISLPVLIRFPQILQARVEEINRAFNTSADKYDCQLTHILCYPVKVNQQKTVIEHILTSHCESVGLEVGSKTELLVALGMLDGREPTLVCNGYKDRAYIRLALYAQIMGYKVFIVIESPSELRVIKQECERLSIQPNLGIRLKLNSVAEGNWQNSGGSNAKFGLDANDILYCLKELKQWNCRKWLKLMHFHMGSQISKLKEFSAGLQEAMHVYSEVCSLGFKLSYIDVGGGLAIDYASKQDTSYFSRSYTIQEYTDVIVSKINQTCESYGLEMPIVLSENGRAVTAHHAMLITNVVKVREHESQGIETYESNYDNNELDQLGVELVKLINDRKNCVKHKDEFEMLLHSKLQKGKVGLLQRAWAEGVLKKCELYLEKNHNSQSLKNSSDNEIYYCNFSVFQSMPDVWGLNQIFPIMPISRLTEAPSVEAKLHDLTCDSDGKITQYAYNDSLHECLTLHEISTSEDYLLGFFLLGAYQEVLGDIHNLFGDTHSINVTQNKKGEIQFTEVEIGDCAEELLKSIHLEGDQVLQRCKERMQAIDATNVTSEEILEEINNALYGYTYLDSVDRPSHRIKR